MSVLVNRSVFIKFSEHHSLKVDRNEAVSPLIVVVGKQGPLWCMATMDSVLSRKNTMFFGPLDAGRALYRCLSVVRDSVSMAHLPRLLLAPLLCKSGV